jgi:hypothetical protein
VKKSIITSIKMEDVFDARCLIGHTEDMDKGKNIHIMRIR